MYRIYEFVGSVYALARVIILTTIQFCVLCHKVLHVVAFFKIILGFLVRVFQRYGVSVNYETSIVTSSILKSASRGANMGRMCMCMDE